MSPGYSNSRTYTSWRCLIQRCTNPKHPYYKDYGGRRIKVCARWKKFKFFLKDMGKRPRNKTLDRIDVNKHYTPSNCKWSTPKQQRKNQRPPVKKVRLQYRSFRNKLPKSWSVLQSAWPVFDGFKGLRNALTSVARAPIQSTLYMVEGW